MAWGGDPWAICDRCGRRRRHRELKREWTQLMVCPECFDPRPVHLDPPKIDAREGMPIKDPRPEQDPVFVTDGNPVTITTDWTAPAATAQTAVTFITDDDPVTAEDL